MEIQKPPYLAESGRKILKSLLYNIYKYIHLTYDIYKYTQSNKSLNNKYTSNKSIINLHSITNFQKFFKK